MINILLATYNGEQYLKEQIDSLLSQTYQEFKILVRDDNSKDSTINIIQEYEKVYPVKIKLIQDDFGNLGSSKSFMKLLEYSDREYIMFCDQDDVWLPNKIELSLQKIKELENETKIDIPLLVFSDLHVVNESLKIIENSFWKYQKLIPKTAKNWKKLVAQNVITGCTIIMNKRAKEVSLPFVLDMMIHDQWIGVNVAKYGKIAYIDKQTILYRQHGKNVAGAHSYGFKYISSKLMQIKKILNYFQQASKYFKEISILEIIFYKMQTNISRLVIKNEKN
jgi:glycosyltransferase involved in cell wall biosynthesis